MPRPFKFGQCVLPFGHAGDCVGGECLPCKQDSVSTPWVQKQYSCFDPDPQRPRPPSMPIARAVTREHKIIRGRKNPELQGFNFKLDDIYGSRSAGMKAHTQWPLPGLSGHGKLPDPYPDWTHRPGYGRAPAYLGEQQHLHTSSVASLRSEIPAPGGASSSRGMSRVGSASHLSTSRSSGGLIVSNATVRLLEHPLAWKLHPNGVNVTRNLSARQPAGANHARPGTPAGPPSMAPITLTSSRSVSRVGSAATLRQPALAAAPSASNLPDAGASFALDDDAKSAVALAAPTTRPVTPAPLCATFGLHPAFPRGRRTVAVA